MRRCLIADGRWQRQRNRVKHRQRRERRARFGELVQIDGSHRKWFGQEQEFFCLMDTVDDATGESLALMAEMFCFEKTVAVANDWTVRFENRFYQILERNEHMPRPGQKVTVRRLLDGTIQVLYSDKKLRFKQIAAPEAPLRYSKPAAARATVAKKKHKPAPDHPWRRTRSTAARTTKPK